MLSATALSYSSFETTITKTIGQGTTTIVTQGGSTIATNSSSAVDCDALAASSAALNGGGMPLVVGNNHYQCERVLVIPPNSNGALVVSYRTDVNAVSPPSEGGSEIANFTASVLAPIYSRAVTIPEQILGYTNATGVTITPSMHFVNVTAAGNESLTLTYSINVSSGVRGFFELNYLDACPTMIPLAVGYGVSQLNTSSFPDYQPFLQGCTSLIMLSGGNLISTSGIETAWMTQSIGQPEVANDESGLQLRLSLNATSITRGEWVRISIEEYNTLLEVNNVTSARDWAVSYLTVGPCGVLNSPMGFAILSGRYTNSNISSAKQLELYQPGMYSCPAMLSDIRSYAFLPMNSTASVYGSCSPSLCFSAEMNSTGTTRGYWGTSLLGSSSFQTFSPGIYTVVAGDEWSGIVFAYFTVS